MNPNPYRPPLEISAAPSSSGEVSVGKWLFVMFLFMVTPGMVLLAATLL